jgi:hypothetical protein
VGGPGMIASDEFSQYYAELLQGTYDCVDRIVLNVLSTGTNWRRRALVVATLVRRRFESRR